jgi:hypothetical protein
VEKVTEKDKETVLAEGEQIVMLDIERVLRMDFNALAKAEEVTGKNMLNADTWRDMRATDYRALAWACMLDHYPDITIEQVGKLITPKKEPLISSALLTLYISEGAAPIDDKETVTAPFVKDGGGGGQ